MAKLTPRMANKLGNKPLNVTFSLELYPLQREIYDHPARFKVVVAGRQAGKSFLAKYIALQQAINEGKKVMWVSPTYKTALPHWNEVNEWLNGAKLPILNLRYNTMELFFVGGGYLCIRSATEPDNLRGAGWDTIILDEASFYNDGEYIYNSVITPMVTATGGNIIILTTPRGKNWVYKLFLKGGSPNKYYKSWHMTSADSPYQDLELLEDIRSSIPEWRWQEEYLAEFLENRGGLFVGMDACLTGETIPKPLPMSTYVAGVDWGAVNDYTAFAVFDRSSRALVALERWTGLSPTYQIARIRDLLQLWKPILTHIEMNGIGDTFWRLLLEEADTPVQDNDLGVFSVSMAGLRLKGVMLNNHMKRSMLERLATDIDKAKVILPKDRPYLIDEMLNIERVDSGVSVDYRTPSGYHDDALMATAYAYMGIPMSDKTREFRADKRLHNPFKRGKRRA